MEIFVSVFLSYTLMIQAVRGEWFIKPDSSSAELYINETYMRGFPLYEFETKDTESTFNLVSQIPGGYYFALMGEYLVAMRELNYESNENIFEVVVSATLPTESPGMTATTTLTVILTDVNERPGIINNGTNGGSVDFYENQPVGTKIDIDLVGLDQDAGTILTWTIRSNFLFFYVPQAHSTFGWAVLVITEGTTFFTIDSSSGVITSTKVFDYETESGTYIFQVGLFDNGSPPLYANEYQIALHIRNVNEYTPTFSSLSYSGTVAEKTAAGHSIIDLTATDDDANTVITMAVENGDDVSPKFTMSSTTLQTTSNQIDYSSLSGSNYKYILEITASDGEKTGTTTVTITVTAVNLNAPVWSTFSPVYVDQTTPYYVDEGASATSIVTVSAIDSDSGLDGQVIYAIIGTPVSENGAPVSGLFQLNGNTGILSTSNAMPDRDTDYEYFDITIRAEDQGSPSRSTDRVIRVGLTDVNENAPVCTQSTFSGSVDENVATGSSVLTIGATDSDVTSTNNVITYTLTGGSGSSVFTVGSSSGIISTASSIDYEGVKNYDIKVTIEDNGSPTNSATCTAQITVNDRNDMAPFFPRNSLTVAILEDSLIGTTVTAVLASDGDSSSNNNNQVVYSFVPTSSLFGIGSSTGIVTVTAALDRETVGSHNLTIYATDQGLPRNTGTMTLTVSLTDVNDNAPVISSIGPMSINEGIAGGTEFFTVTASDADDVANANLNYSISSGNTNSRFSIHSVTGVVSIQNALDREQLDSYQLEIRVSDSGTPSLSSTLTVDITIEDSNDNSPVFNSSPYVFNLIENSSIGSTVGVLQASDSDIGTNAQLTFSSMDTDGSHFSLHSTTGILVTSASFDRENKDRYVFRVTVRDGGTSPLTATSSVTVSITDDNDNTPVFNQASYTVSTTENNPISTSILSITVTDGDIGINSEIILSIDTSGDGATADSFISVDSVTSVLSVKQPFDRESHESFNFTLVATDQGNPARSSFVTITVLVLDVNDNSPVFSLSSYSLNVSEAASTNSIIYSMSASDSDDGTNGVVSFSIQSFIRGDNTHFTLNPFDGAMQTASSLDRETENLYKMVVIASDGGSTPRSSTTTVTITITDYNDNTPTFSQASYSISTTENQPIGTSILQVTVTDDDIGLNSDITLSIDTLSVGGIRADTFISVDSSTSILSVKQPIDRESDPSFNFTLVAADQGNPAKSSSVEVYVGIIDQNDNSPSFQFSSYSMSVSETFPIGSILGIVFASDPDEGSNGNVEVHVQSFTPSDKVHLRLDSSNGTLTSNATLDRETTDMYEMVVVASDGGSVPRSSTTTVTVSITDINDNIPTFSRASYLISTTENQPIGTSILQVTVTDDDIGLNSDIILSIDTSSVDGIRADTFISVDSSTSILSVKQPIDRESDPSFNFTLVAADQGNPAKSSSVEVYVGIIDQNDNSPSFQFSSYSMSVSEIFPIGSILGIVFASDPDEGSNGNVEVHVQSFTPTGNVHLRLDSSNGTLTSNATLDRETTNIYEMVVVASDGGSVPQSSTTTVTVSITDVNDNIPTFSQESYSVSTTENHPIGTSILQVTVTDDDIGLNSNILLSIDTSSLAGVRADTFILVDSSTSILSVKQPIDRESDPSFNFTLVAADQGNPRHSSSVTIIVSVLDVNDNSPVFSLSAYSLNVSESAPINTTVGIVLASDADDGTNSFVTLSFDSFIDGNSAHFDISSSGTITSSSDLDRETLDMYKIVVKATDGGQSALTSTTTVTISVTDFNDNPPIYSANSYEASVIENAVAGTSLVSIGLTDLDIGVNSEVVLSIDTSTQSGAKADLFIKVNSSTSILSVKQPVDFEKDQTFEFFLLATDQGTPALSSSAFINITIMDANDNEPVFTPSFVSTEMSFDNACEVTLTTLSVSDADSSSNGDVTLATLEPFNTSVFFFNETAGFIEVINKTDKDRMYLIYIMATDSGSPSLNSSTKMTIRIDTFEPRDVILSYHMDINCTTYLHSESQFLSLLTDVFNESYPTCYARRWCVSEGSNSTSCIVHAYIIENDAADERHEINNTKDFLVADDAFELAALDDLGTPAEILQESAFVITKVEKYNRTVTEDNSTPWIASGVGIAIVTSSSILGVIGVASAATRAGLNLCNAHNMTGNETGTTGEDGVGGNNLSTTETGLQSTGNSSSEDLPRVSIAEEVNLDNTDGGLASGSGEQQGSASPGPRVVQVEPISDA